MENKSIKIHKYNISSEIELIDSQCQNEKCKQEILPSSYKSLRSTSGPAFNSSYELIF